MFGKSNPVAVKAFFSICLTFSLISDVYSTTTSIEQCANRCAIKYCGMAADTKVYTCQPNPSQDNGGYVNFELSDEDKMKLPYCFELIITGTANTDNTNTFKTLENKAKFDECLRACKIELVNWCIP